MKTYAINLPQHHARRDNILNECEKYGIDVEIFSAVDGRTLTDEQIRELVFAHQTNGLTRGEIGAALSHLHIYQKMRDENIPVALILEDDAVFNLDPRPLLDAIARRGSDEPHFYMLTVSHRRKYVRNHQLDIAGNRFYEVVNDTGTYGYVLTNRAAINLARFLLPIRTVADDYRYFIFNDVAKVWVIDTAVVGLNAPLAEDSIIETERKEQFASGKRKQLGRRLRKMTPLAKRAKYYLWKYFKRPFLDIADDWKERQH